MPSQAKLLLSDEVPKPDQAPHNDIDDNTGEKYSNNIPGHSDWALFIRLGIEEAVSVKTLGSLGYVCKSEVERKDDDKEGKVRPWRKVSSGNQDFKHGKGAVHYMLADIRPGLEFDAEPPSLGIIDQGPEHNGDDEWEYEYCGVQHGVGSFENAGKTIDKRPSISSVGESVNSSECKIKCDPPVRQHGEVAEVIAGAGAACEVVLAIAIVVATVRAVPADDYEESREGVDRLY